MFGALGIVSGIKPGAPAHVGTYKAVEVKWGLAQREPHALYGGWMSPTRCVRAPHPM